MTTRAPRPICTCCGTNWSTPPDARTDTGPIHSRCWDEHHSDPTGEWPPGHVCYASTEETTDE